LTQETMLRGRALLVVAVAGILAAAIATVAALWVLSYRESRYRAEMQVALLPGSQVPAAEVADYWEALSRGQAARIGAEVLAQRRWMAPAAQAAGVPVGSISTNAGPVEGTSLIDLAAEAASPAAAETAVDTVFREARPLAEQVSGPFALEIVQDPWGSAVPVGTSRTQLLAVAAAAGLLIGVGGALLVIRRQRTVALTAIDVQVDPPAPLARGEALDRAGLSSTADIHLDERFARSSVPRTSESFNAGREGGDGPSNDDGSSEPA
jgi:hypothetical protein